jgi:hypothetical protein
VRRAALVALALASIGAAARALPPPILEIDAEQRLMVGRLAAVLDEETVARQLESGLTTTFFFRVEAAGRVLGGARVDVRYDLWDEVFEVAALGAGGRGERATLAGRAALEAWWSGLELVVAERGSLGASAPRELVLALEVVPFSASEQDDAQRWFARSFGDSAASAGPRVTDPAERRGDSLEKVLGVLMATSIRGSALYTTRWAVAVTGGR